MAKIYYKQIKKGNITIYDVPDRWLGAVQALLDADNPKEETPVTEPTTEDTPAAE